MWSFKEGKSRTACSRGVVLLRRGGEVFAGKSQNGEFRASPSRGDGETHTTIFNIFFICMNTETKFLYFCSTKATPYFLVRT